MKLHVNTVSKNTFEVLNNLMQEEELSSFILVGGTALALQIGHRISVDLDLFSSKEFDKAALLKYMQGRFGFRLPAFSDIAIHGFIGTLKIDLVHYENGFLDEHLVYDGIRMAGLREIAAMKLEAIANMSNRIKDYVDIAFLSEHLSLSQMLAGFREKFDYDEVFVLRSLNIFSEVDTTHEVFLTHGNFNWEVVKRRIIEMTSSPTLVFPPMEM